MLSEIKLEANRTWTSSVAKCRNALNAGRWMCTIEFKELAGLSYAVVLLHSLRWSFLWEVLCLRESMF